MVESWTLNRKVASSGLGPAVIVGGGSECTALSPPSIPRRGALYNLLFFGKQSAAQQRFTVKIKKKNWIIPLKIKMY